MRHAKKTLDCDYETCLKLLFYSLDLDAETLSLICLVFGFCFLFVLKKTRNRNSFGIDNTLAPTHEVS